MTPQDKRDKGLCDWPGCENPAIIVLRGGCQLCGDHHLAMAQAERATEPLHAHE